jgi:hypothetical protein
MGLLRWFEKKKNDELTDGQTKPMGLQLILKKRPELKRGQTLYLRWYSWFLELSHHLETSGHPNDEQTHAASLALFIFLSGHYENHPNDEMDLAYQLCIEVFETAGMGAAEIKNFMLIVDENVDYFSAYSSSHSLKSGDDLRRFSEAVAQRIVAGSPLLAGVSVGVMMKAFLTRNNAPLAFL